MKMEKTEGKAPIDLGEQNHPPNARGTTQKVAGSAGDKMRATPNEPAR